MPNYEPHWAFNTQPTGEDATQFTPTFVARAPYDYDDASLGCEAMIGELDSGIRAFWQK